MRKFARGRERAAVTFRRAFPEASERLRATRRGERDGVTGPWWVSFEQMLDEDQRRRVGLSEDRGAVLCVTRVCAALTDAEVELEEAKATIKSIATMLGWMNVPPRETLERSVAALKARTRATLDEALNSGNGTYKP